MTKNIIILGASGSVGRQALDVARARGYKIDAISVGSNIIEAERAAREFNPRVVAVADETAAADLKLRLSDTAVRTHKKLLVCGGKTSFE